MSTHTVTLHTAMMSARVTIDIRPDEPDQLGPRWQARVVDPGQQMIEAMFADRYPIIETGRGERAAIRAERRDGRDVVFEFTRGGRPPTTLEVG